MRYRPKKISYGVFVSSIFKLLHEDEKNRLFYCSLFDPSSWEEIVEHQREFLEFQRGAQQRISKLIKSKNPSVFKKYMGSDKKKNYFFRSFVHNGDLCVFMLAAALEEKNVNVPYRSICGQSFPDLIINVKGVPKAGIEVKRLIGCSNLKERIDDEVISGFKGGLNKLLLLLIFPAVGSDDPFRIHQLTGGYYIFEDYIRSKIPKKGINVLCRCVCDKSKNSKYTFESLVDSIHIYCQEEVF